MPVIKSAKKKQRKDIKREKRNDKLRVALVRILKSSRKNPSSKAISSAFQTIDKASKKGLIHANKAARVKSSLSKLISTKTPKALPPKTNKTPKKQSKKSSK